MTNTTTAARFADQPAAAGQTVMQGHADYCKANGHATHRVDGVVQPHCARCGIYTGAGPITAGDIVAFPNSRNVFTVVSIDADDVADTIGNGGLRRSGPVESLRFVGRPPLDS